MSEGLTEPTTSPSTTSTDAYYRVTGGRISSSTRHPIIIPMNAIYPA